MIVADVVQALSAHDRTTSAVVGVVEPRLVESAGHPMIGVHQPVGVQAGRSQIAVIAADEASAGK